MSASVDSKSMPPPMPSAPIPVVDVAAAPSFVSVSQPQPSPPQSAPVALVPAPIVKIKKERIYVILREEDSSLLSVANQELKGLGDTYTDFFKLVEFFRKHIQTAKTMHESQRVKWIVDMVTKFIQGQYPEEDNFPKTYVDLLPALPDLLIYVDSQATIEPAPVPEKQHRSCTPW